MLKVLVGGAVGAIAIIIAVAIIATRPYVPFLANVPFWSSIFGMEEFEGHIDVSGENLGELASRGFYIDITDGSMNVEPTPITSLFWWMSGSVGEQERVGDTRIYTMDEGDALQAVNDGPHGTDMGFEYDKAVVKVLIPDGIEEGEPRGRLGFVVYFYTDDPIGESNGLNRLSWTYFEFHGDGSVEYNAAGRSLHDSDFDEYGKYDPSSPDFSESDNPAFSSGKWNVDEGVLQLSGDYWSATVDITEGLSVSDEGSQASKTDGTSATSQDSGSVDNASGAQHDEAAPIDWDADPETIIANLGPYSDGTTGTYENIPNTPIKQMWLAAMPQGRTEGQVYRLGLNGEYLWAGGLRDWTLDPSSPGYSGVPQVDAILEQLNAPPDVFFQDASGTWYKGTYEDYPVIFNCSQDEMNIIVCLPS